MTPMRRLVPFTGFAAALLMLAAALAPPSAAAVTLKPAVTVSDDVVRLGDLFVGVDAAADVIVAPAPAPGKKQTLHHHRLSAIARSHDLDWKPAGPRSQTVVTRAARLIDIGEIETALREALSRQGLPKDHKIELFNRSVRIYAPVDSTQPFEIRNARFDAAAGRFSASLVMTDDDQVRRVVGLNGRVYSLVEIPVPVRPLRPDEVISRGDVEWIAVRSNRVNRNAISELSELVGRSPRRPLRVGAPIRRSDVRDPVIVAKGTIVSLELRTRRMTLSAKVKATEDGAMGQTIRLLNPRSNRTVEGVVVGPGRVVVPTAIASASGS